LKASTKFFSFGQLASWLVNWLDSIFCSSALEGSQLATS